MIAHGCALILEIINMEQRSKEWFDARKNRVTGSMVGAILGVNPWMNRDDAMRSMIRAAKGAESEFTGNIATNYGQENEPNALSDYEMTTGKDVQEVGFFIHPEHDWLGASPDGIINGDGILEIKCPFGKRHDVDNTFVSIELQPHYYAQVQIEMFCTGLKWAHFYQWSAYNDSLEFIELDEKWIEENLPVLKQFYDDYLVELKNPDRHLAPLIKSVDAEKAAKKYRDATMMLELAKAQQEDAKAELIKLADGQKSNISGLLVTPVERAGSIAYAKAVKDLLPNANLDPYRGKSTSYWMIK
jgi:putative phage-type endonuclease